MKITAMVVQIIGLGMLLGAPSLALAQNADPDAAAVAPIGPPIQPINSAAAISAASFVNLGLIRELSDGRILVNDGGQRRLLVMDTALQTVSVVLDSLPEASNYYGNRPGALIPFRADTTFFVDSESYAVLVIDPSGKVVRTRSIWRVEHLGSFLSVAQGVAGLDARGRLVYRVAARPAPQPPAPAGVLFVPTPPDSAFLVAVDLNTRMVDTLTSIRIPKSDISIRQSMDGGFRIGQVINPLPSADDWSVLADGRVAVIRGIDYRIDYLNTDGSWSSSEKLPFDWRRLTDLDKRRMVDSVRTAQYRTVGATHTTAMIRWVNNYNQQYPESFTVPEGYVVAPGLPEGWRLPGGLTFPANYIYGCPAGVQPTVVGGDGGFPPGAAGNVQTFQGPPGGGPQIIGGAPAGAVIMQGPPREPGAAPGVAVMPGPEGRPVPTAPGAPAAQGTPSCIPQPTVVLASSVPAPPPPPIVEVMSADVIPDFRPPLPPTNSARADADGNLWIRIMPSNPTPGGFVYDIISPAGELVSRYQIPAGYTILGFGKGKVVYMSMRDASGIHLARVRLR